MTKKIWVKLYMEILDDPKMGRLTDHLWRLVVELFLLAGRAENDGVLPPVDDMAWALRQPEDRLHDDLKSLAEAGIVHETEPGQWVVTNFKERQYSESAERVKRYSNGECNGGCNGDVMRCRYFSCYIFI